MGLIVKIDRYMPKNCEECFAGQNLANYCELLKFIDLGISYTEFDDEWHLAHKENRKLKYCPLQQDIDSHP